MNVNPPSFNDPLRPVQPQQPSAQQPPAQPQQDLALGAPAAPAGQIDIIPDNQEEFGFWQVGVQYVMKDKTMQDKHEAAGRQVFGKVEEELKRVPGLDVKKLVRIWPKKGVIEYEDNAGNTKYLDVPLAIEQGAAPNQDFGSLINSMNELKDLYHQEERVIAKWATRGLYDLGAPNGEVSMKPSPFIQKHNPKLDQKCLVKLFEHKKERGERFSALLKIYIFKQLKPKIIQALERKKAGAEDEIKEACNQIVEQLEKNDFIDQFILASDGLDFKTFEGFLKQDLISQVSTFEAFKAKLPLAETIALKGEDTALIEDAYSLTFTKDDLTTNRRNLEAHLLQNGSLLKKDSIEAPLFMLIHSLASGPLNDDQLNVVAGHRLIAPLLTKQEIQDIADSIEIKNFAAYETAHQDPLPKTEEEIERMEQFISS